MSAHLSRFVLVAICTLWTNGAVAAENVTGPPPGTTAMETPGTSTDTEVTLNRALHFQSPDGTDVVAEPGQYRVEAVEEAHLRLVPQAGGAPLTIRAWPSTHEVPAGSPVALAIPQGEDEQHVVLLYPGGKSLDAPGSSSAVRGRGTTVLLPPSVIQQTVEQQRPRAQIPQQNPCSMGRDPQPNITRWSPFGRVWPGGKIIFEGQNLDPSRFVAAIGSAPQVIVPTIVSASPTRIETQVPIRPDGGPYTPVTGAQLSVSYSGSVGCKLLNPAFIVADAFTVETREGGGRNGAYFWIRHQMDLTGEIEGARTITLLSGNDPAVRSLFPDPRVVCDWAELQPSGRTITLTDNRIHHSLFGFVRDHRNPTSSASVSCKLPVNVVIQDPMTNISQNELFVIPMTIRTPRTVAVDSRKVITDFHGVQPSLLPQGGAIGDCGKLYAGDPSGDPKSTIGVTVQNDDWVFSIKSGIISTVCRFNSLPVEANLGVAFGPFMGWEVTNMGDPKKCFASPPAGFNGAIGIFHRLESMQVYLSCDPGPLSDNRVTIRATSINLLVPHEYMPPSISLEVRQ